MAGPETTSQIPGQLPGVPDPEKLAQAWAGLFEASLTAWRSGLERVQQAPDPIPYDPLAPFRNFVSVAMSIYGNPDQFRKVQTAALEQWTSLWAATTKRILDGEAEPVVTPERGDRRFSDPAWSEQPFFDYIKQAYLLASRQVLATINENAEVDPATRTRADFYARQYLNALSPANFIFTNPEALKKTVETGGANLIAGLANLVADAGSPGQLPARRTKDGFVFGENIAATKGSVVYQNDLIQLIQYTPTTDTVYRPPVLYIPPLVNKYYLIDLQPKSSLVKWLVDQGHTVFVVSWVNPGPELGETDITDYVIQGPVSALAAIEALTGERQVDIFSFCMGGVIATLALGYLAAKGEADRAKSCTMIGTLIDFRDMGEWSTFLEPQQLERFEQHLKSKGYIEAHTLQALFSVVRANDLIWPSVVNHYLLDREAPPSDLLYWFADGARMPGRFLLSYTKEILGENGLTKPGAVKIGDVAIDLSKIKTPMMVISLKDDHVSAWTATYEGARLFGGPVTFLLGGSGHNAGLINPPSANKHGFWTNPKLPKTADKWFENATKNEGSWWPTWQAWLATSGKEDKVPARTIVDPVEPAPGSYAAGR